MSNENGNYLFSLDGSTGKVKWKSYLSGGGWSSEMEFSGNSLLFFEGGWAGDKYLFNMGMNGEVNWKFLVKRPLRNGPFFNKPIIFDGKAFFLSDYDEITANLTGINIKTGMKKVVFEFPSMPNTNPVFYNNKIYIGCKDGLYIYDYPKIE